MALPKLNNTPKYPVVMPSTKQEVQIRPFVVKEEKILLIAMESQDPRQIANSILDTVTSCIIEDVDDRTLTSYDVEYLFLQIRSKSVGSMSKVMMKCKECESDTEVVVNIDEIKIDGEVLPKKIKITDDIVLEMKQPTYRDIAKNENVVGQGNNMDRIFALIHESIDAVQTEDERISFSDVPHGEAIEFLESMTTEQFTKIREYMEKMPAIKHTVDWDCQHCGTHNTITLEGMQSFF